MKKIVYAVLIVLVLGGAVFFVYSQNKSKKQPAKQYGILNPNPDNGIYQSGGGSNQGGSAPAQNPQPAPAENKPQAPAKVTTEKPKVLGTEQTAPAPKPAPKSVPKPVSTPAANALSLYKIPELSFEVSVPNSWQPRLETNAGNILAFYNSGGGLIGQIEVVPDAQESADALLAELQANSAISGISQTSFMGQTAFVYTDQRYGKVIAFTYKNNVYYLRGANAVQPYLSYLKLI